MSSRFFGRRTFTEDPGVFLFSLSLQPTGARVSTTKPTPRHGTRARYRLEIKKQHDGSRGVACDRCKAANSKAVAAARANRTASVKRAGLHIVDAPAEAPVADTPADTPAPDADEPKPGPMELAIQQDINEIPEHLRVPMHRSLSVLAIETARDFDTSGESATARNQARRELSDLISKLRTRRDGDGDTAVHAYLEDLGSGPPRVSGRGA